MRLLLSLLVLVFSLPVGALENVLKGHASPYLAMHGDDPVHWQDWSDEVLAIAQRENKLILISSGYFSCHWCHVMQRESYQDKGVAAQLNAHFIPVKLDRELHPALDAHLIDFTERTSGVAGWPLNVFLTPEGYPLVGLTYAPRDNFVALLGRVQALWEQEPAQARALAEGAMAEIVKARSHLAKADPRPPAELIPALHQEALTQANELEGGFGDQSRFPMAPQILALINTVGDDARLRAFLITTLDQMAQAGLRDQLAGGFFRYTVDPSWQVPHYEKMLYDQALLIQVFLRAGKAFDRPDYLAVATDTLDFVLRDMAHPAGGFIASLSALDAAGDEGGAYLWTPEQLEQVLSGEQLALARAHWRMTGVPATEGGYLPLLGKPAAELAGGDAPAHVQALLDDARQRLLAARAARGLPRDEKRLAGWNGLMLQALVQAAKQLDNARYREQAQRLARFLVDRMWDGSRLKRSLDGGHAGLEDYAQVAAGLLAAGDDTAAAVLAQAWRRFYSAAGWRRTDRGLLPGMAVEPAVIDDVLPSPSATVIRVSMMTGMETERAAQARLAAAGTVAASPFWYAGHTLLLAGDPTQR